MANHYAIWVTLHISCRRSLQNFAGCSLHAQRGKLYVFFTINCILQYSAVNDFTCIEVRIYKRKQESKKKRKKVFLFFLGRFLGREHVFFLTVIVFSWSLYWSRACFLFFLFFIDAFLVKSLFLTFLFSFINSQPWPAYDSWLSIYFKVFCLGKVLRICKL